jgi:hypothetical protein
MNRPFENRSATQYPDEDMDRPNEIREAKR